MYKKITVSEHRLIASIKMGRKLAPTEQVHHLDGDPTNNTPENLMVLPAHLHREYHRRKEEKIEPLVRVGDLYF